jgi:trimeric autotransporter adhesin
MRALVFALRVFLMLWATSACSRIIGIDEVKEGHLIGGQVNGLWDGTEGVTLRLEADDVDTLLTVTANDAFSFPKSIAPGTPYVVTVAASPMQHWCTIDGNGNGIVENADIMNVSVKCTGPMVQIVLSGRWGRSFDPTQDMQMFSGSLAMQDVTLKISGGSLTGATVNGISATLGAETVPILLPLGSTTLPVSLTASGGLSKTYQIIFSRGASFHDQVVYGKASNAEANDNFGHSIALSGDTLAIGAPNESSAATGVDGDQFNNSAPGAGAVYIFVRNGTVWTQQAYIKASNTKGGHGFGKSIALSEDTLAVGTITEASAATGINGNQSDQSALGAGAVYVFVRSGTTWTQQAYVKASNTESYDYFGYSIALSGNTLAVGAASEDSEATGIDGSQANDYAHDSGAVYVFVRNGTTWTQQSYIKASNTGDKDGFGSSIALAGDTLAVGAPFEDSAATGINGSQNSGYTLDSGSVYVFARTGTTWAQQAYVKASNTGPNDKFGSSVALYRDTLAVGAGHESSAAVGINGNQADNSANSAGAVYVFDRTGTTWVQQAYVKASNAGANDIFGSSIALYGDTLAVGAPFEASAAIGVNGNQADGSASKAGAVYVFVRSGTMWTQQAYVKASNTDASDQFGSSVALSGDTLVVGALGEASTATGIGGDQSNNSANSAGAVYVFR